MFGQDQAFIAPVGRDIRGLPGKVDVIFGVDFQLFRNFPPQNSQLRPNASELRDIIGTPPVERGQNWERPSMTLDADSTALFPDFPRRDK